MYFYAVAVASSKYMGSSPLTYSCKKSLKKGQLVKVELRKFSCTGFVLDKVEKPSFKTQPVSVVVDGLVLPTSSLKLFTWMAGYYPGPIGHLAQSFMPASQPAGTSATGKVGAAEKTELPDLAAEQKTAVDKINSAKSGTFLLHGITGSGKTRVYLELARKCIKQNKSAIILTPEISLTPQIVAYFKSVFGDKVLLTHSGLTPTQRARTWQACLADDKPYIVMGPRSALFSPINKLGLVIIDEAHDGSYKQDRTPFYNTLRVAGYLASITDSKLVMGSATPSVNEYFLAQTKGIPIINMKNKALGKVAPAQIQIVDMTDKNEAGKYPLLTNTLVKNITKTLKNNRQAMIFINKRGDSKSIVCQNCGWQAKCMRCDLPLTYHADEYRFSCHTCGKNYPSKTACDECNSTDIIFKNPGTKAITEYLSKLFPSAHVARFDTDNKKAERIDARHQEIVGGDIDILVGTQLLTKGHDLPRLELVAMLVAESGLNFPDFTSEERTFQTIHQLAGRVGRGHTKGKVIIQSFNPDNALIKQSVNGSYSDFYKTQIEERKTYGFPPFYHLLKITSPKASSESSLTSIKKIRDQVLNDHPGCVPVGPSPAFHFKRSGKFNWQLIVKSKKRSSLTDIINNLPSGSISNIDPSNLL
jgi:primosomal protein N' (replication factor Y)